MPVSRYTYWRTPEGKPCQTDQQKHAPIYLLNEIGRLSTTPPTGGITWPVDIHRLEHPAIAMAMIQDSDERELNENDTQEIIRKALAHVIRSEGGGKAVSPSELLRQADRLASEYFRKPVSQFRMISSLAINSFPVKSMTVKTCEISPARRSRYPLPGTFREDHPIPAGFVCVGVRTSGRSIHEAAAIAFEALDLVRGIWNLMATRGRWRWGFGSTIRKPLGVICKGPYHTLHNLNRKPVDDLYWYEPSHLEKKEVFNPENGWARLEKDRRWAMVRLRCLPYSNELSDLLVRYAIALDQSDPNLAFLQLWSILERLTDTIGKYNETVSRSSWCFEDAHIAREMAESLRQQRNRYVHGGQVEIASDQTAQLVKLFVDSHLLILFRNEFNVKSFQEYGEHIALPRTMVELRRKHRQITKAIHRLIRIKP